MADALEGVVFTPWKKHYTVLGVKMGYYPRILAALALGVALFLAAGLPTVEYERELTTLEANSALSELEDLRDAMAAYEALAEASGTPALSSLDMTDEERERVRLARAYGIDGSTSDEELEGLVPATTTDTRQRFGAVGRFFALVLLPTALAFVWHLEMQHGWCLAEEAGRLAAFGRRQRFYPTRRQSYIGYRDGTAEEGA